VQRQRLFTEHVQLEDYFGTRVLYYLKVKNSVERKSGTVSSREESTYSEYCTCVVIQTKKLTSTMEQYL
jgi:hypothetical protein